MAEHPCPQCVQKGFVRQHFAKSAGWCASTVGALRQALRPVILVTELVEVTIRAEVRKKYNDQSDVINLPMQLYSALVTIPLILRIVGLTLDET